MEVSLVLSVRQLHDGQNHLLSESKISGFRHLEKEELMLGDNGIVRMSNFSSLAEKQKHWVHETLILMVFEIKSSHWLPLKCLIRIYQCRSTGVFLLHVLVLLPFAMNYLDFRQIVWNFWGKFWGRFLEYLHNVVKQFELKFKFKWILIFSHAVFFLLFVVLFINHWI